MRPPLTDAEYRWFSEWLGQEYGLVFGPEKRDILRARLEPRRAALGFDSFDQLYFHLKFHPDRRREREQLIPHLTNNESYFFREPNQLDVFREEVLPALRKHPAAQKRQEIKILSAGCAAGEEPYTLAMILREANLFPASWKVQIIGIDLDTAALQRAKSARYPKSAFRRIDPALKAKYFTDRGDGTWALNEKIRRMVDFDQSNLATGDWVRRIRGVDVIFCRNVLIYFSQETLRSVADDFYKALAPGGYLFLGHAESLSRTPTRLETVRRPGAVFYRRPEAPGE